MVRGSWSFCCYGCCTLLIYSSSTCISVQLRYVYMYTWSYTMMYLIGYLEDLFLVYMLLRSLTV